MGSAHLPRTPHLRPDPAASPLPYSSECLPLSLPLSLLFISLQVSAGSLKLHHTAKPLLNFLASIFEGPSLLIGART